VTSIRVNRQHWNLISRAYQEDHDPQIGAAARLWGMFAIPDARLNALGEVTGKRVLELGCGAGQWSRSLAAEGAAVVGLDLSEAQLAAAATAMGAARYPLVQAAAQQLPFAAASFDVVFCDHGGLSWAPAHLAVPQAARVLRRGGRQFPRFIPPSRTRPSATFAAGSAIPVSHHVGTRHRPPIRYLLQSSAHRAKGGGSGHQS